MQHPSSSTTPICFGATRRLLPLLVSLLMFADLLPVAVSNPTTALANSATSTFDLAWTSNEIEPSFMVIWGDVDNDGDLDLAVANGDFIVAGSVRLYLNENGTLTKSAIWSAPPGTKGAIAWGDVDNDSDLDLVVNQAGAILLFRNCTVRNDECAPNDTILSARPAWQSGSENKGGDVLWGDYDGDADLDLFVVNDPDFRDKSQIIPSEVHVFRNHAGVLDNTPIWIHKTEEKGYIRVALADIDGDKDLDLSLGVIGIGEISCDGEMPKPAERIIIYRNEGSDADSAPNFKQVQEYPVSDISALAWGDYDNDGKLDLAVSSGAPCAEKLDSRVYRNMSTLNKIELTPVRQFDPPPLAIDVAWSDYDNDGDLDLAFGNYGEGNQVYRNDGPDSENRPMFRLAWEAPDKDATLGVAWGDYDGDGDDDLVSAEFLHPNKLYRNEGGVLRPSAVWESKETHKANSVVWGDYDNDGDLDLAIGNNGRDQLYRNCTANSGACVKDNGTTPLLELVWSSQAQDDTRSLAWGDYDNDGDLDLAAGNNGQSLLYRNDGVGSDQRPVLTPITFTDLQNDTRSLAWGDYDNDGDLDLAAGNNGKSLLYRNGGVGLDGQPVFDAISFTDQSDDTWSVAWGDADGDGDLDLAVGNGGNPLLGQVGQRNRLYRNDGLEANGLTPVFKLIWTSNEADDTRSLAWGDYDNDGKLDLGVGNRGYYRQPNRLYRNTGGTLSLGASWTSEHSDYTNDVAWGDADGDGDLDLVAANDEHFRFYRNQGGALRTIPAWSVELFQFTDVTTTAWGDVDQDGDLDLVAGSNGQSVRLYRNGTNGQAHLVNNPPTVAVHRPVSIPDANFFSTAARLDDRLIKIPYTLADPEGNQVREVRAFYSVDGGGHWRKAVSADNKTIDLPAPPTGQHYTFTWDTFASNFFGQSDQVVFRIEAIPDLRGIQHAVSKDYQRSRVAATTFPFRVRGTQVRVVSAERPDGVANAQVYHLPKGATRGGKPIAGSDLQPYQTDKHGYLQGRGEVGIGDRLVVVVPVEEKSRFPHNNKYTLYHTSAAPTSTGLNTFVVTEGGVQTLTVSSANSLTLFNLAVSLEWDARADAKFMSQLRFDLQRASELLYDWSDGQATLGEIAIHHDKQHWETADIRIYATNRFRPNATQGGIVSREFADPDNPEIIYESGEVRMGPGWSRSGDGDGTLGEDWPRALAHELGHYALFLDDNYLGINTAGLVSQIEGCRGAMTDPYRDDYSEFIPPGQEWDTNCKDTVAERTTGRSDWETIRAFYQQLRQPDRFNTNAGPSILPLAVTQIREFPDHRENMPLVAPGFALVTPAGTRYLPSSGAKAFLFRQQADTTSAPSRVIDLGQPSLDQVLARGARVGDRLCVFDLAARTADGQLQPSLGCQTIATGMSHLTIHPRPGWQPEVLITNINATQLTVQVPKQGVGEPAPATLSARLFPADVAAEPINAVLTLQGEAYTGSFAFAEGNAVFEGSIHVWIDENSEPRRDVVADFRLGGNPAPPRRPRTRSRRRAPVVSADGQVILYADNLNFKAGEFFSLQSTTALPVAVPPWTSVVGQSYRLLTSSDELFNQKVSINIGYLDSDLPPGTEAGIAMYYHKPGGTGWEQLATTLSTDHNEASAQARGAGVYALMTRVEMQRGWNIFSYPWTAPLPVPEALALMNVSRGDYTTVYGYDSNDAADPWKVYDVDVPDWVNDLPQLEYGRGYWVNVTNTAAPAQSLGAGDPAHAAAAGSLPYPPATYYGPVPTNAGFTPRPGMAVVAMIDDVVCGETETKEHAGTVVFAVDVIAAGIGETSACGVPGRRVVFHVDGHVLPLSPVWDNSRPHAYSEHRTYLPRISMSALESSEPDLMLSAIEVLPSTPVAGQAAEIRVTVRNTGTSDIIDPFWVDLYVNPDEPPDLNHIWPELCETGAAWRVYSLKAGESIMLSTNAPNDPKNQSKRYSNFTTFTHAASHQLYALVDSFGDEGADGAVAERDEDNNRMGPRSIAVIGAGATYAVTPTRALDPRP